ncbi:MAG: hypothetical protein PHO01_08710, partial [Desulfotomaculaceae bacterium]|nr:hypothetical protein [Desulfotomaculaceae bacterium]
DGKVFDLQYFEPIIKSDKLNIYSLQVGDGSEETPTSKAKISILIRDLFQTMTLPPFSSRILL